MIDGLLPDIRAGIDKNEAKKIWITLVEALVWAG
jgi:hypothetical protein